MKKLFRSVVLMLLIMVLLAAPCSALSKNYDYMYDGTGKSYSAPVSFVADQVYTGVDMGTTALYSPQDLYVDSEGLIYIADTRNNRIVIVNSDFQFQREILEYVEIVTTVDEETQEEKTEEVVTSFNKPEGVFYGPDKLLYVCDTENKQVVALDISKERAIVVKKDDGSKIIAVNENIEFKPNKVAVDNELTIYVVSSNVYQGILQYDKDLNFESFFAPNDVEVTAAVKLQTMWKEFFSDEQGDYMQQTLPLPYNNIFMSKDNLMYTTAIGVPIGTELKCLNAIGKNILITPESLAGQVAYGDREYIVDGTTTVSNEFVDVHCDENGVLTALDQFKNRIFQYDKDCNLICIFGGYGNTKGKFAKPVAIEKIGDKYMVLDSSMNSITTFVATDYIDRVYEALEYYNDGRYNESVELWENILKLNNNYTTAYRSIGRAYLQQGRYKEAMEMLKEGNDKYFYSLALKEYRKEFTRDNLWWMLIVFVAVLVGVVIGIKRLRFWLQSKPYPKKSKKG